MVAKGWRLHQRLAVLFPTRLKGRRQRFNVPSDRRNRADPRLSSRAFAAAARNTCSAVPHLEKYRASPRYARDDCTLARRRRDVARALRRAALLNS